MVEIDTITSEAQVWELLATIPDPDIPVISIVELGIVRNVKLEVGGEIIVTITPSYSGCPAMGVFKEEIKLLLMKYGAKAVHIKVSHAPAWNTDWLNEATKLKMKEYGIAPPEKLLGKDAVLFSDSQVKKTCPHCDQKNTKLISQFGSTPCKSLWYCNTCEQPFEYFKCY